MKGTLGKIEQRSMASFRSTRHGPSLLEPFAAVPVRSVEARAQGVDLSQIVAGSPRTRLSLDVKLAGESKVTYGGPVRIDNAEPGSWDRGLLPFTSASARVTFSPQRVDVTSLAVALVGGGSASGRATIHNPGVRNAGVEADLRVADVDLSASQLQGEVWGVTAKGDRARRRLRSALEIEGRHPCARIGWETVRIRTGGGAVVAKGGIARGPQEFRFEDARSISTRRRS